MWDRKVLKARGKRAFKANYWKCVLVALILTIVAGAGTGTSGFSTTRSINDARDNGNQAEEQYDNDFDVDDELDDIIDDYDFDDSELDDINNPPIDINDLGGNKTDGLGGLGTAIAGIVLIVVLIAFAIGVLIAVFLLNPLQVGCRRFFVKNSDSKEAADVGDVGFAFSTNYGNVVKTMFFKDLWVFLWTLLLIVPGIIKSFEYRMVPYLLAENPNMDRKEALKVSTEMMYGNKWNAFVLDLSFFGWILLSACTLGILGIFYVDPYVAATDAELYKTISGKRSGFADEADAAAEAAIAADAEASVEVPAKEIADEPKAPEEDVIVTFNESDGETYIDDIYD
jgi:hypothetical protein